ncbi:hypothetical protein [Elizabethkingia anophelis]|uniref:hypothetical protein n=1 Tax=Elizabethkingia anophelis TaxID=1117645 RepID=UPI0012B19B42|nr:hypothetical protein [Elizabethkingia anophelis]QGN21581.1 hypothetical protein GJV56_02610 [Elizabethkingia anophelis]QNV08243.1 hypothetical protein EIY88_02610 [Elizabethkingia anophelis]UTF89984.1 hypothetical protein J2N93_02615 [Elizabethkingia anophelis]UTG00855.1 hypothetical protein J2O04_02615 [Elizabethkingia anophelis]UTG04605.1 hypothetical protein J2O03_02620 [Elizabethkingia anophelis]
MKNNTEISERINQMIDYLGLNTNEFAKKLQYNRSQALYDILNGKSKPSFDFFERFDNSEYSELFNYEWLIGSKGEMLKNNNSVNLVELHAETPNYQHRVPQVITVDSHNRDNISLVPLKLKAGYLEGYNDPNFIRKLPTFRVPGLNNGIFRMFEIEGNSMFPTLPDRTHVIGQFVENWITDIKDDQLYAIISNEVEDGLVKRCLNRIEKYNNLICKSDNRRNYPTQNLDPRTIKEIWEIKLHLNWQLPNPADIYDRMNDFEAELQQIKSRLK